MEERKTHDMCSVGTHDVAALGDLETAPCKSYEGYPSTSPSLAPRHRGQLCRPAQADSNPIYGGPTRRLVLQHSNDRGLTNGVRLWLALSKESPYLVLRTPNRVLAQPFPLGLLARLCVRSLASRYRFGKKNRI